MSQILRVKTAARHLASCIAMRPSISIAHRSRSVATKLRAGRSGFRIPVEMTLSPKVQPRIQWVHGYFPGLKRPECHVDHSHLCSSKVKNEWTYTSPPPVCHSWDIKGWKGKCVLGRACRRQSSCRGIFQGMDRACIQTRAIYNTDKKCLQVHCQRWLPVRICMAAKCRPWSLHTASISTTPPTPHPSSWWTSFIWCLYRVLLCYVVRSWMMCTAHPVLFGR
jgi:hypothetical protein